MLADVFLTIFNDAGRRTRRGQTQAQIADELRPALEVVLDDLERWFRSSASSPTPPARRR